MGSVYHASYKCVIIRGTKVGAALCNMARSLDQILAEVTARSDPQRQIVLSQISQLPTQQAADEASLGAKKDQAYEDIVSGARRRGLGFSGIPLGEQAKYNATEYAPAVANLKSTYGTRKSTLESALADIGSRDYSTAYDMFNQDRSFEEQQRQFNEQLTESRRQAARVATSPSPTFGGTEKKRASAARKQDGGFAFSDAAGQPISAARYAQLTGQPIGNLLYSLGQEGDTYAQQLYNQLKNDPSFGKGNAQYDARVKATYAPIFWGT